MLLFVSHYVFNVEYDDQFKLFYLFLQHFLVGMTSSEKLPNKLRSFLNKVQHKTLRAVKAKEKGSLQEK
jgi:hypothetical protein